MSDAPTAPAPPAPAAGPGGPPAAPARREPVLLRVLGGVLVAVAAVWFAVVESFLVPLRIGSVPFPVCILLAAVGNVLLARLAARWTDTTFGAAIPPVLWLLVVMVLAARRDEGDLVVPGTTVALLFLFVGAVAGAFGVASTISRRVKPVRRA